MSTKILCQIFLPHTLEALVTEEAAEEEEGVRATGVGGGGGVDPVVVGDGRWGFEGNEAGVIFKLCEMGVEEGTKGVAHVEASLVGDGWMSENVLNKAGENVFDGFEGVKARFVDAVRGRVSLAVVGHVSAFVAVVVVICVRYFLHLAKLRDKLPEGRASVLAIIDHDGFHVLIYLEVQDRYYHHVHQYGTGRMGPEVVAANPGKWDVFHVSVFGLFVPWENVWYGAN